MTASGVNLVREEINLLEDKGVCSNQSREIRDKSKSKTKDAHCSTSSGHQGQETVQQFKTPNKQLQTSNISSSLFFNEQFLFCWGEMNKKAL